MQPPAPVFADPQRSLEMTSESRESPRHLGPFRFLIKQDRDGRHRWYLYNPSGTVIGRHAAGFSSGLEAHQDVERIREELANAPIIGESGSLPIAAIPG